MLPIESNNPSITSFNENHILFFIVYLLYWICLMVLEHRLNDDGILQFNSSEWKLPSYEQEQWCDSKPLASPLGNQTEWVQLSHLKITNSNYSIHSLEDHILSDVQSERKIPNNVTIKRTAKTVEESSRRNIKRYSLELVDDTEYHS